MCGRSCLAYASYSEAFTAQTLVGIGQGRLDLRSFVRADGKRTIGELTTTRESEAVAALYGLHVTFKYHEVHLLAVCKMYILIVL